MKVLICWILKNSFIINSKNNKPESVKLFLNIQESEEI